MAITKRTEMVQVDGAQVERRIEERTTKVHIATPLSAEGMAAYRVVVYREWVEYLAGQPVRITPLPPLEIQLTAGLATIMRNIAMAIDANARIATRDGLWPRDGAGQLMPMP